MELSEDGSSCQFFITTFISFGRWRGWREGERERGGIERVANKEGEGTRMRWVGKM